MLNTIIKEKFLAEEISDTLNQIIEQDLSNGNSFFLRIENDLIEKFSRKIVRNSAKPIIVGVCGESASGKTTLAQRVLNACLHEGNRDIYTLITLDDYYYDTSKELEECGGYEGLFATGFTFDSPDAFNLDLVKEHIQGLLQGKCVYSPEYDFVSCKSHLDRKLKSPARIILVEGLFALNPTLREMLDVAIYVHTPPHVIKDRWYKRAASRGKTGPAADMQYNNVTREAQKYIHPAKDEADVVVSGLISAEYIEFMAEQFIGSIKNVICQYY